VPPSLTAADGATDGAVLSAGGPLLVAAGCSPMATGRGVPQAANMIAVAATIARFVDAPWNLLLLSTRPARVSSTCAVHPRRSRWSARIVARHSMGVDSSGLSNQSLSLAFRPSGLCHRPRRASMPLMRIGDAVSRTDWVATTWRPPGR